jgi:hypothetical protein
MNGHLPVVRSTTHVSGVQAPEWKFDTWQINLSFAMLDWQKGNRASHKAASASISKAFGSLM